MREWLVGDKRRTLKPWARDSAMLETVYAHSQGTFFESPIMWYRAFVENYHYEVEKDLPLEVDQVGVPLIHIAGAEDSIGPPQLYDDPEMQALVPDLTTMSLRFCPSRRMFSMTPCAWRDGSIEYSGARGMVI